MYGRILAGFLALSLVCSVPMAHAQAAGDRPNKSVSAGPRRHLANIIFAGLAGAVLGLSTLSFYGRPQDKLNNIAIGAAVGIIGGTIFSTYKAASQPREFYGDEFAPWPELWAQTNVVDRSAGDWVLPRMSYTFEF